MLSRIDKYIVETQNKNHDKPYRRFATSKFGYTLTTLLVLKVSVDEIMSKREEGQLILSAVFIVAAVLIAFYSARHLFWKKKIDRFEYRLKIFETIIVLYTGFDNWGRLYDKAPNDLFTYVYPLCIIILALAYLFMARIFYLKYLGKIKH